MIWGDKQSWESLLLKLGDCGKGLMQFGGVVLVSELSLRSPISNQGYLGVRQDEVYEAGDWVEVFHGEGTS